MNDVGEQFVKYGKMTHYVLEISFAQRQAVEQLDKLNSMLVQDVPLNKLAGKVVSSEEYFISTKIPTFLPLGCFICKV